MSIKYEIRISKFETNTNHQNSKPVLKLEFLSFDIVSYFGFSA